MLRKLFGGIKMTWPRLILFAVISGVVTALIALLVPEGNSIKQIAVTFEVWIVLAIIIVVNCEQPLEAACKTFVCFLVFPPLVYLIQVPRLRWRRTETVSTSHTEIQYVPITQNCRFAGCCKMSLWK